MDASDLSSSRKPLRHLPWVFTYGRKCAGPFLMLAGQQTIHRWPMLLMQPGNDDPVISKVTARRHGSAYVFRAQSSGSDCTGRLWLRDNCRKTSAERKQVINYTWTKAMQMGTKLIREQPDSSDKKKTFSAHR